MTRMLTSSVEIEPQTVYLSPSGRPCRLASLRYGDVALLMYDRANGTPAKGRTGDGFFLTHANWRLLRRVG